MKPGSEGGTGSLEPVAMSASFVVGDVERQEERREVTT